MIVVDECIRSGAPWPGGTSCHLLSDESERELLDFAQKVRIPLAWYQARATVPHFDLSPSWRRRAVAAGAIEVDRGALVEAIRRWRAKHSS
jgi:hypothetical protein